MSKRAHIQRHLGLLDEVSGIMGAMKNISLMETHKLARYLAYQHRVLASIEAAAADFLAHHPEFGYRDRGQSTRVIVAIGSQRGFCGDFNEAIVRAINRHRQSGESALGVLVVGRRLAVRLGKDESVLAALDGPSVVEEVHPVLQRVMNALGELQSRLGQSEPLDVALFAHRDGEEAVGVRHILPRPASAGAVPVAYPPLLNLPPPAFFSELVRHYLWAQMHDAFYSTLMAENRRRLQHMEGAMKRIEEKSSDLRRRYNALRQEEITEEIEVIMLSNDALQKDARPARGLDVESGETAAR